MGFNRFLNEYVASFHRFYEEVYLPDHAAPMNRWVHFLSNLMALFFLGLALYFWSLYFLAVGVFCQLGPPYFGHILFEKTHRSIDQSPLFAAMGSWYTTFQIFLGKQSVTYGPHVSQHHRTRNGKDSVSQIDQKFEPNHESERRVDFKEE